MAANVRLLRESDTHSRIHKDNVLLVKSQPVTSSYILKDSKVRSRVTGSVIPSYFCDRPPREEVRKANITRRHSQLKHRGFFCPNSQKYQTIDGPEMNDKQLIKAALSQGQSCDSLSKEGVSNGSKKQAAVKRPQSGFSTAQSSRGYLETIPDHLSMQQQKLSNCQKGRTLSVLLSNNEADEPTVTEETPKKTWSAPRDPSEPHPGLHLSVSSQDVGHALPHVVQDMSEKGLQYWYSVLCTIWWILEATRLKSCKGFMPFKDCWKAGRYYISQSGEDHRCSKEEWTSFYHKPSPVAGGKTSKVHHQAGISSRGTAKPAPSAKYTAAIDRMKKQRKLTVDQLEELSIYLDEQLSHSKKSYSLASLPSRAPSTSVEKMPSPRNEEPPICVSRMKDQFDQIQKEHERIVHEQLSTHKKKHIQRNEQKLTNIHCTGSMWADLCALRLISPIESSTEAKKKLIMNCKWLDEIVAVLPVSVKTDYSCQVVLHKLRILSKFMEQVSPEAMCQERLLKTLSILRTWEIMVPEVLGSIKIITSSIIFVKPEDFEAWIEEHCGSLSTKQ